MLRILVSTFTTVKKTRFESFLYKSCWCLFKTVFFQLQLGVMIMFANMVKLSEVLSSLKTYKIKKLRKPNSSYERLVIGYKLFAFTIIIENNLKLHIILDCTPHLPGWPAFLLRQCRLGSSNCITQHRKDISFLFFRP